MKLNKPLNTEGFRRERKAPLIRSSVGYESLCMGLLGDVMTREQHLLLILSEECAEVTHRVSKALRFGLSEIEPGQELTNAQRISQEVADLSGMIGMLRDAGVIPEVSIGDVNNKVEKVEKFLRYSQECGTLETT